MKELRLFLQKKTKRKDGKKLKTVLKQIIFFVFLLMITATGFAMERAEMGADKRVALDNFFTCFSKRGVPAFRQDSLPVEELLNFGVMHVKEHFGEETKSINSYVRGVPQARVVEMVRVYFGRDVKPVSTKQFTLNKQGYYEVPEADGGGFVFTQIDRMVLVNDKFVDCDVTVYSAPSSFNGDEHAGAAEWNKDPETKPEVIGRFHARLTPAAEEPTRYVLREYTKIN